MPGKMDHLPLEKWSIYLWKMVHLSLENGLCMVPVPGKCFSSCKVGVGVGKNCFPAAKWWSASLAQPRPAWADLGQPGQLGSP